MSSGLCQHSVPRQSEQRPAGPARLSRAADGSGSEIRSGVLWKRLEEEQQPEDDLAIPEEDAGSGQVEGELLQSLRQDAHFIKAAPLHMHRNTDSLCSCGSV